MPASLPGRTLARADFGEAFAAPAFVRAMLDFEAALAQAQAEEGVIDDASAEAIAKACATIHVDADALVAEGKRSATLAVPLVRMLKEEVGRHSPLAASQVHFGATSQDVLDTAMALCLRPCLEEADRTLEGVVASLAHKAEEHRDTPMLGRTLMQPAVPITAGLKLGRWALALAEDRECLAHAQSEGLALQLGGPVGALETMGEAAPVVRHRVAMTLGLADVASWQVHRNTWLELMGRIAQVVATAGKIAGDLALLQQPEVGEMQEAPPREGVGASSAMPHKRNPVACAHALAATTRMPWLLAAMHAASLGEHERGLGGWQAEAALVPEIASVLGTSLDFLDTIAASLVVDARRMKANVVTYGEGLEPADFGPAMDELLARLARHHP